MKYLVRVPISKLAGPYKAHQQVYAAVPETARPLWRRYSGYAIVLADNPSIEFEAKEYDPSPANGTSVRFSLLVEIAVERGEPGKTQRVDPVLAAWLASGKKESWTSLGFEIGRQWLLNRQATHGFRLMSTETAQYEVMEFMREGKKIRIGTVDFTGIMEISESEKFKKAMLNGIGHSKAWGLGLLLCNRT